MSNHRHKLMKEKKKMAKGGSTKEHFITGEGSPEAHEAEAKEDGFKRGGKKLKSGGSVHHAKSHKRLDKKPRHKMAAGGSPLTTANKMSKYSDDDAGRGFQKSGSKSEDNTAGQIEGRESYKAGGWIAGATKNKGALHRKLHVPEGEKIPAKKLTKAANSEDPTLRREGILAKTLSKLRKK